MIAKIGFSGVHAQARVGIDIKSNSSFFIGLFIYSGFRWSRKKPTVNCMRDISNLLIPCNIVVLCKNQTSVGPGNNANIGGL